MASSITAKKFYVIGPRRKTARGLKASRPLWASSRCLRGSATWGWTTRLRPLWRSSGTRQSFQRVTSTRWASAARRRPLKMTKKRPLTWSQSPTTLAAVPSTSPSKPRTRSPNTPAQSKCPETRRSTPSASFQKSSARVTLTPLRSSSWRPHLAKEMYLAFLLAVSLSRVLLLQPTSGWTKTVLGESRGMSCHPDISSVKSDQLDIYLYYDFRV